MDFSNRLAYHNNITEINSENLHDSRLKIKQKMGKILDFIA